MASKGYLEDNGLLYYDQIIKGRLAGKVNTESGKGLSDNNLTDELKQKILDAGTGSFTGNYSDLIGLPTLDGTQIKGTLTKAGLGIAATSEIPSALSQLTNDSGYLDENAVLVLIQSGIAALETGFLKYKGQVDTKTNLPSGYTGLNNGWMYYVIDEADSYYWLADSWHKIDFDADMSQYLKVTDIRPITNSEIDIICSA